ncbi:MAG TPA: tyrosinase family protein [Oculatellaceae cyanobacterium]
MAIRKNIKTAGQIDKYIAGVKALKNSPYSSPSSPATNRYDAYIYTHYNVASLVHLTPLFLPWHRAFLMAFERDLQSALSDPNFGLPYWDWTEDASDQTGANSIWIPSMMGTIDSNGWVSTGAFAGSANWPCVNTNDNPRFGANLLRAMQLHVAARQTGSTYTTRRIVDDVFNCTSYDQFRRALEYGPHNSSHVWVGGQMGNVPNSVNDPAFWLHHANVDRIWAQWQTLHSSYPVTSPLDPRFGPNLSMPPTFDQSGVLQVKDVTNVIPGTYSYASNYQINLQAMAMHRGLYDWQPRGNDTHLKWQTFDTSSESWSSNNSWGARSDTNSSLATFNGTLFTANKGSGDSNIWWSSFDPTVQQWATESMRSSLSDDCPALASHINLALTFSYLFCVHRGSGDTNLWWSKFDPSTGLWEGDRNWGALSDFGPALADYNGKLYCMHKGSGDSDLWWCTYDDASQGWTQDSPYGGMSDSAPALAVYRDELFCVHRGTGDQNLWWTSFNYQTSQWNSDQEFTAGNLTGGPPTLFVINDTLYCAHRGKLGDVWTDDANLYWCKFNPTSRTWSGDTRFNTDGNGQSCAGTGVAAYSYSPIGAALTAQECADEAENRPVVKLST